jgi:hypothetical protein
MYSIAGEYNLPNVTFSNNCNDGLIFSGIHSDKSDVRFECCQLNYFCQYYNNYYNFVSILDLIFSNILNTTDIVTNDILIPIDSYHPTFETFFF